MWQYRQRMSSQVTAPTGSGSRGKVSGLLMAKTVGDNRFRHTVATRDAAGDLR